MNKVRDINILNGYESNDTICVKDYNDGGNLRCSENRRLVVITEQNNYNY